MKEKHIRYAETVQRMETTKTQAHLLRAPIRLFIVQSYEL